MTIQREIKGFADPDPEYSAKAREILARQSSPRSGGLESSVSPEVLQEAARMIDLRNKAYCKHRHRPSFPVNQKSEVLF